MATSVSRKRSFGTYRESQAQLNCPNASALLSRSPEKQQVDKMDEDFSLTKRLKLDIVDINKLSQDHFPMPKPIGMNEISEIFQILHVDVYPLLFFFIEKVEMDQILKGKKQMYSEKDVKTIVSERENLIREEYNVILQELLQQQFNNFVKFNYDCISKQFKETYVTLSLSYIYIYC